MKEKPLRPVSAVKWEIGKKIRNMPMISQEVIESSLS